MVVLVYMPDYGETPLITKSINHLQGLRSLAEQYQSMGIFVPVALLIISDGFPNNEEVETEKNLRKSLKQGIILSVWDARR